MINSLKYLKLPSKDYIKLKKYKFIIFLLILLLIIRRKKKIGVIGLSHGTNIGNNLVKYAIFIKLSELGFEPYIIGSRKLDRDISFINKSTNLRIIKKNFTEIKRNDYDILMVNSDQTWRKFDKHFHDYAFLKFAKNWNISKFIYGASIGFNFWKFSKEDERIAKECLKDFIGISVREIGSISLIYKHLEIIPSFVLDPTLLINKKYYLNIIRSYKSNIKSNTKFIFTYLFFREKRVINFIRKSSEKLNYKVNAITMETPNNIQKFIYGISHCRAVITESFHGTIFSIIFNKPFITFINKNNPIERFITLKKLFKIGNRMVYYNQNPNITLLTIPLNIDYNLINSFKIKSINYLKKNLKKSNK